MYEEQMAEACARTARSSGFDGAEDIVEHDPGAQSPENEILWRQLKSLRKTNVNWAAIS